MIQAKCYRKNHLKKKKKTSQIPVYIKAFFLEKNNDTENENLDL